MNRQIKFLNFSDIHLNHKRMTPEILDNIINMISARAFELDFVTFSGDLLYTPVVFGSVGSEALVDFVGKLNGIGVQVFMISGTRSHEGNVIEFCGKLNLFENIIFISKMTPLTSFFTKAGVSVKLLFLPEEYVTNIEEHYADVFYNEQFYDAIILHGNIKTFAYTENDTERYNPKMVDWDPELLLDHTNIVLAGHYHTAAGKDYPNNKFIGYTGSITAFDFTDLTEKKMDLTTITYDENGVYQYFKIEYIPNHYSPKLMVYAIDSTNSELMFLEENYKNANVKLVIQKKEIPEASLLQFKKLKGRLCKVDYVQDFNSYKEIDFEKIDKINAMEIPEQIIDFCESDLDKEFVEKFTKPNFSIF